MRSPFFLLAYQHLRHRPLRTVLTVLGVAVGVSSAIAIQISNEAVLRAFRQSVSQVTGPVTLQISGGELGFDETLISKIRHLPGVLKADPILVKSAVIAKGPNTGRSLLVWGVDLIAGVNEGNVRIKRTEQEVFPWEESFAGDAIFLGKGLAAELGVKVGQSLILGIGGRQVSVVVRGLIDPRPGRAHPDEPFVIMDIASMQHTIHQMGRLDRIHLVTQQKENIDLVKERVQAVLPSHLLVTRPSYRNQQIERMIRVFQMNLTTLSMIGLLIGTFLVYNAMAFSVVQYRKEIGIFRAIGMSRQQIARVFLTEAGILGFCGGVLGAGLGGLLSHFLMTLIEQSVSELYASVSTQRLQTSLSWYGFGGILGLGISLCGAVGPCLQAGHISPVKALAPGSYEETRRLSVGRSAWLAMVLFLIAGALALPGPINGIPIWGYGSAFCILLACTALGPLAVLGLTRISRWHDQGLRWLAVDNLLKNPGRNSVTLSALMVGISIVLGVGMMVKSFRGTVEMWVDQTLLADFIIAPLSWVNGEDNGRLNHQLPLEIWNRVTDLPGVLEVDPYRQIQSRIGGRDVTMVTRDFDIHATRSRYMFVEGNSQNILQEAKAKGGVILSEVLSHSLGLGKGDGVTIPTESGERQFPIAGVFYDYATDGGKVVMDQSLYRKFWGEPGITVLAVYLDKGTDRSVIRNHIQHQLGTRYPIVVISNQELREEILEIFDRTFRVTHGLEIIALVVAFLGIVNTLITSIIERQRELSCFRAIGASAVQIKKMIVWEACYIGLLGAVLGVLGGVLLTILLIHVINKQSFGWTIQFSLSWLTILQGVSLSFIAALLASIFPAHWAIKQPIGEGLRYD